MNDFGYNADVKRKSSRNNPQHLEERKEREKEKPLNLFDSYFVVILRFKSLS